MCFNFVWGSWLISQLSDGLHFHLNAKITSSGVILPPFPPYKGKENSNTNNIAPSEFKKGYNLYSLSNQYMLYKKVCILKEIIREYNWKFELPHLECNTIKNYHISVLETYQTCNHHVNNPFQLTLPLIYFIFSPSILTIGIITVCYYFLWICSFTDLLLSVNFILPHHIKSIPKVFLICYSCNFWFLVSFYETC